MRASLVAFGAAGVLILVSGCGSESTSTPSVESAPLVESGEGESPEGMGEKTAEESSLEMSKSEAADYYLASVCASNEFSDVRYTQFELAQQGILDTQILAQAIPLDVMAVREAADLLDNPPKAWPSDVETLIAERAQLLREYADVIAQAAETSDADDYLDWWDRGVAFNSSTNSVTRPIRSALGIPEDTSCPDSQDPVVLEFVDALDAQKGPELLIDCYGLVDGDDREFGSLTAYWRATEEGWEPDFCTVEVASVDVESLPKEQQDAIDLYGTRFDDGPQDKADSYSDLIDNCVGDPSGGFGEMVGAQATLMFCPEHPRAKLIEQFASGSRIVDDGRHTLGEEITAGTWKSVGSVSDCYWERVTPNGQTIANDFITFAPDGAVVSVKSTDGAFVTEGCGAWRKTQ